MNPLWLLLLVPTLGAGVALGVWWALQVERDLMQSGIWR